MADITAAFGFGFEGAIQTNAAANDGVTPVFFVDTIENEAKTAQEGRPIFDEVECVRMLIAGDPYNQIVNPVDATIKRRFAEQYRRWKENREDRVISGTPLKMWPLLSQAQIREMEALSIFSVEALAGVADSNIERMPGLRDWREKAKAWLAQAKDGAEAARLAGELEKSKVEIAELRDQMKRMSEQFEGLLAAEKRRRKDAA